MSAHDILMSAHPDLILNADVEPAHIGRSNR